nr:hypothetical protein [Tenacibaculum maritimum]
MFKSPATTATPFNVSFVSAFPATPPTNPFTVVPLKLSSFATIVDAPTVISTVAVSQFVGFNFSQI